MTREYPEISADTIDARSAAITADERWFYARTMRLEQEYHWFVASPGILVGDLSFDLPHVDGLTVNDGAVLTTASMQGSEGVKLNAQSVVSYSSYTLPKDDKKSRSIYEKMHMPALQAPENFRHIGRLAVLEPGMPIFRPIKFETEFYFDLASETRGKQVAIDGLSLFLNNRAAILQDDDAQEITEEIKRVQIVNRERRGKESGDLFKLLKRKQLPLIGRFL